MSIRLGLINNQSIVVSQFCLNRSGGVWQLLSICKQLPFQNSVLFFFIRGELIEPFITNARISSEATKKNYPFGIIDLSGKRVQFLFIAREAYAEGKKTRLVNSKRQILTSAHELLGVSLTVDSQY